MLHSIVAPRECPMGFDPIRQASADTAVRGLTIPQFSQWMLLAMNKFLIRIALRLKDPV
jgi:hypothetical protein